MKFKIDENLPVEVATLLQQAAHDAATVADEGLSGGTDQNLIAACAREGRCLITLDLDFADMRSYPPGDYAGIMVIRVRRQDKPYLLGVLSRVLPLMDMEQLDQRLWIVEENRIRIRGE